MKKIISMLLILFACFTTLVACGETSLNDNPPTNANVIGNGGYAVVKGDYLYYVNGYIEDHANVLTNAKTDNKFGEVVFGGIYRTKLVNGKLDKDANGFLTKTERVVSKVVGFSNGAFYIIGDYIYYATPHMDKDDSGKVRSDYVSFAKINIDGTDNEIFYTSYSSIETSNWNIYNYNGKVYLVVAEAVTEESTTTHTIKSVDIENGKTVTLASKVDSYAFNKENNLEIQNGFSYNEYIYYTRTFEDKANSSSIIARASIVTGKEETFNFDATATYKIMYLENDSIYYTMAKTNMNTDLWRIDITSSNIVNTTPVRLTNGGYNNFYVIDGVLNNVIVVNSSNAMYYMVNGVVSGAPILEVAVTVVGISDSCVYYLEESILKRVNYVNGAMTTVTGDDKTYLTSTINQIDMDGRYIYVFANYTASDESTHYYLNQINTFAEEMSGEFVGLFDDNHTPKQPTADEYENGAVWVK